MTNPKPPIPETNEHPSGAVTTNKRSNDTTPNATESETQGPKPPKGSGLGVSLMPGELQVSESDSGGSDTGGNSEPKAGLGAPPVRDSGP